MEMLWLQRLRKMKKDSGLTTSEISERSGIPEPTLEKIFSGTTKAPKLPTMQELVHFFGYTLDDLVESEQKKESFAQQKDSAETKDIAIRLYSALIAGGWIKEGQDITEQQLEMLDGISKILSALFDQ